MAKDNAKSCVHLIEFYGFGGICKDESHHKESYNCLEEVSYKGDGTALCPEGSKCIGGAGIAASVFSYVCMFKFSVDISGLNEAEGIAYYYAQYSFHYFSFLSLTKNFKGVPEKPKDSLMRFSKYRRYEKCINSLLFTNITNVGGFTLTWVV